jgi:hypothetical protein
MGSEINIAIGMYSRSTWGGPVDPFILVKFMSGESDGDAPIASMVIFEWGDSELIGYPNPQGSGNVRLPNLNSVAACDSDTAR